MKKHKINKSRMYVFTSISIWRNVYKLFIKVRKELRNMFRSRKEMQSLIDSSRKSLAEAELQIAERNKLIRNEIAEKEQLKSKIKDLENNIEFIVNNLSAKKRELVQPSHQN